MKAPPDTTVRLGLVGSGSDLAKAIDALKGLPAVEITVVADASDRSEGAKLARSLKLPVVKNAMEVFRTKATLVLEVNGDERQYERLLSIKPAGVEVMSAKGARLLIDLLQQGGTAAPGGVTVKEVVKEVVREVPREVIKEVIKEVPREVIKEVVKEVPVEVIKEVVREVPVIKEVVREVPVEVVKEVVREVPVERGGSVTGGVKEVIREIPVEILREVEVVKEVVREVPVEVVKEVVREVPVEVVRAVSGTGGVKEVIKEVPVEILREVEVVKEVPVEVVRGLSRADEEEMGRLRRRVEELEASHDKLGSLGAQGSGDEKMQALLNMASGVGHVFNNVLAGVLGRTQLLLRKAERDKAKELYTGLAEIEAATRTGIDALARVQEFSRNRPSESFGRVDLNDLVQRAVDQTRSKWREEPAAKGVRIEVITHFGAHTPIVGSEAELLDAVSQVIANAVDAMPRGGKLTIRTGSDPGRGWISLSDTGVGMSESVKRRAFEPFFSTKGETGLGLGLSTVYGIIVRHGGEASIESEEGKGTTITLRIPTAAEKAPVSAAGRDADRSQVLVVDDDETVRTALGDMLRGAGYAVTLAASGLEGIAKVREREGSFDLVVTDLGMPDVPGWEVVEAAKQVETGTPVVIMSGFDRARATRRAKELGVEFVISKPFDLQDFLNTIRGLLVGRKRP